MCGIVGFISLKDDTRKYSKDKYIREALFADTLRGTASTGIMQVADEFRWAYHKKAVPGPEYLDEKDIIERSFEAWCTIGHNRAATVGQVTANNAHPFQHDDILLVHNGTLRNTYPLPYQNVNIAVDSELIAYNLSKVEPDEAHTVLEQLNGAFALIWFDNRDESVNIVRNGERPLHFGVNKAADLLLIASDGYMLNFIANRIGDASSRPQGIWQIATHQHLKYKKGSLVPEVASISPFTYPVIQRSTYIPPTTNRGGTTWEETGKDRRDHGFVPTRAMIAGKLKEIPKPHQVMLQEWYQCRPGQDIFFLPKTFLPWGTSGQGEIHGKVFHEEWDSYFDCRVPGVTQVAAQAYMCPGPNGTVPAWTVSLIGVDHTDITGHTQENHAMTFIGRPKWYNWHGEIPRTAGDKEILKQYEEALQEQVDDWEVQDEGYGRVTGPHGDITLESYDVLTSDGCVMCGGNLDVTEHEEITWVGEMGNQPLCEACLEYSTRGQEYDVPY